jgi:hypothetical protein
VEGIAAQFVETHAQLANLATNYGENFEPINAVQATSALDASTLSLSVNSSHSAPPLMGLTRQEAASYYDSLIPLPKQTQTSHPQLPSSKSTTTTPDLVSLPVTDDPTIPPRAQLDSVSGKASNRAVTNMGITELIPTSDIRDASNRVAAGARVVDGAAQNEQAIETQQLTHNPPSETVEMIPALHDQAEPYLHYDKAGRPRFSSGVQNSRPASERLFTNMPLEATPASDAVVAAPTSTFGASISDREERGKRPNYLKSNKEAWLPNVSAAPPGGMLTPDWAGQQ